MILDGENMMMQADALLAGICLNPLNSMELLTREPLHTFKDTYSFGISGRTAPIGH